MQTLEYQHPPIDMAMLPNDNCALVLGGVVAQSDTPVTGLNMHDSIDRVHTAARLYKSGKAANIIVAAGNLPWGDNSVAEADLIVELLYEWGVPLNRIWLDRSSRNTYENAVNSRALMESANCKVGLLVTSGYHMPRAMDTFAKQQISVYPVPVDVILVENPQLTIFSFLPDVRALDTTTLAIKEYIGSWYYRWRDWT